MVSRLPEAAIGFLAGMFGWFTLDLLVGNPLGAIWWERGAPVVGLLTAALWLSRWRGVVWVSGLFLAVAILVVSYSPLAGMGIRTLVGRDPLAKVDAVVVLSSSLARDGELSQTHLERVLKGMELMQAGYAPTMVITQLPPPFVSSRPAVLRQMAALGLDFPVLETPGQVVNTHDEALEVSKMARSRGWRRVILVTHPFHMRRAAAVFQKAGVPVLRAPCRERKYQENDLRGPEEHLSAFRHWFHEWIGLIIYRQRGWI